MSTKLKKYRKFRATGYTCREAAIASGYGVTIAEAKQAEADALKYALVRAGLTIKQVAEKIIEGLDAHDFRGCADFNARHKYLETVLKIKGEVGFVPRGQSDGRPSVQITIVRSNGDEQNVGAIIDVTATKSNDDLNAEQDTPVTAESADFRKPARITIEK